MSRFVVGVAAVGAIAFGGSAGIAHAAPAPLTGENLSAALSAEVPQQPFLLPCEGLPPYTPPSFAFGGTATGPYAGLFTEIGSTAYACLDYGPQPITHYSVRFMIKTAKAMVIGSERMKGPASVTLFESAGSDGATVGPVSTRYTATITTKTGGCRIDTGTSTATVSQGNEDDNWSATLQDGSFTSTRSEPCSAAARSARPIRRTGGSR